MIAGVLQLVRAACWCPCCTSCRTFRIPRRAATSAPSYASVLSAVSAGALRDPRRATAGRGPGGQHARGARPLGRGAARAQGPGRGGRAGRVRRRGRCGRRRQPHTAGARRGLDSGTCKGLAYMQCALAFTDISASALRACAHPDSGSEAGILRLECSTCVLSEQAGLVRMHVSLLKHHQRCQQRPDLPACQRARRLSVQALLAVPGRDARAALLPSAFEPAAGEAAAAAGEELLSTSPLRLLQARAGAILSLPYPYPCAGEELLSTSPLHLLQAHALRVGPARERARPGHALHKMRARCKVAEAHGPGAAAAHLAAPPGSMRKHCSALHAQFEWGATCALASHVSLQSHRHISRSMISAVCSMHQGYLACGNRALQARMAPHAVRSSLQTRRA